jgi:hypothetical protein
MMINLCQPNANQMAKYPFSEIYVVPSRVVVDLLRRRPADSTFYDIKFEDVSRHKDRWSVFRQRRIRDYEATSSPKYNRGDT